MAVANARMRLLGQEIVVGRQLVKTPYINPQDNRMIPNTVEGVALVRRRDEAQTLDYGFGYLWGFKARDSSYFVPFSQELGVTQDRGVLVAGAKIVPIPGLTLGAIDYTIPDTLNTAFAELDWIFPPLACGVQVRLSFNYTDQRTIGEELMPGSPSRPRRSRDALRPAITMQPCSRPFRQTARAPTSTARSEAFRPTRCWTSSISTMRARRQWSSARPTTSPTSSPTG